MPQRFDLISSSLRIPLNQKPQCLDLVHEDEWELDGTVGNLLHVQPLRAAFAERTLAASALS
jgi:hypothetical protein